MPQLRGSLHSTRVSVPVQTIRGAERQAKRLPRSPWDGRMAQLVHVHAGSPAGSVRPRPRRFGLARGSRPAASRPPAVVSDEQILALVAAAEAAPPRRRL